VATERALLDEINRSIGTLTERVDGLRGDVAESRAESKENRAQVHRRLEEAEGRIDVANSMVLERLAKLERTSDETAAKVAKIEPTIATLTRLQQRGIGAIAVVGLAATMVGGAIAIKWDAFADWLTGLFS